MAAMHPALRLSNLQNLPLRMRLDAQAACRIDGASTQAAGVLFAFDTARLTDAQEVSLLPLIYHVLNPSHLPTLADLDPGSFDDGTKKALTLRILAVNVACKIISIPAAVGPSLWPRIWPWFQFLYANWDQMHIALKMPENPLLFRIFIYFMSRFCHGGSPAAFVLQTPGIRELLFDIWTRQIPAEDHPVRLRILLLNISNFIMPLVPSEKENMDEMVAGAGGSMEDMAELIVSHLQTILTNKQLNLPEDALVHLVRITVGLILHGDFSTLQGVGKLFEVDWHLLPLGELIDALLERSDFLPTLIDSIIALSDTSAADTGRTLDEALMVIERIILCRQGDIDPVKVMHAGILSAIIHCARVEFPGKDLVTPRLRRILVEALDVSCLYRYNAGALDTASKIPEVQQLAQSAAFVHSETYVHWIAFIKAVQDRRRILDLTYARLEGILARHKICDNSECHQMILRRLLQKCAHCQAVSYCSKACQKSDWTNGGHRDACKSYAFLSLTDRSDRYLIYMDRKYIRHLIDDEYYQNFDEIYAKQIVFLATAYFKTGSSSAILPVTVFNHAFGPSRREVHNVEHVTQIVTEFERNPDAQREWADIVKRARRSKGRMALHVIHALYFHVQRIFVVPLWSASGLVWEQVQELARALAAEGRARGGKFKLTEADVLKDARFEAVGAARQLVELELCNVVMGDVQGRGGQLYRLDAAGH